MKTTYVKKPYKKIKLYVISSITLILVTVVSTLILSYILYNILPNYLKLWISILGFIVITLGLAFLNQLLFSSLVKKEVKKHSKFLYLQTTIISIEEISNIPNVEKVNEQIYNLIFENSMLNVISFYYFNEKMSKKEIDVLRRTNIMYLKKKYPVAKENNSRKKHLEIKIQVYISNFEADAMQFLTIGGERLYEIGLIRCGLDVSSGKLYIPFYKGENLGVHALLNYDRGINKLIKIFNVAKLEELEN